MFSAISLIFFFEPFRPPQFPKPPTSYPLFPGHDIPQRNIFKGLFLGVSSQDADRGAPFLRNYERYEAVKQRGEAARVFAPRALI